jgi:S-DNA-T family DNA segregation ATPase FtsK/SpoIIIE
VARKKAKSRGQGRQQGRIGELFSSFLFGQPLDEDASARVRELMGLLQIGLSLWLLVSLASFNLEYWAVLPDEVMGVAGKPAAGNFGGKVGFYLAKWALSFIGYAGYLFAVLGICWGFVIVARKSVELPVIRTTGAALFVMSFAFILDLGFVDIGVAQREELAGISGSMPHGPGGWLAYVYNPVLVDRFGHPGLWVLLLTMSLISFALATEMAFYPAMVAFGEWASERRERWGEDLFPALWGWMKGLVGGLWDFLRGADLEPVTAGAKSKKKAKAKAKAKPKPKKAAPKKPKKKAEPEEEEEELGEDEEWVYEYEDEEEEEEEEEYEDEEPEDEYEDEEEEYEEEEEEVEIVPPSKSKKKSKPGVIAKVASAAVAKARKNTFTKAVYDPPTPPPGPWTLPNLDLLILPDETKGMDREFLEKCANDLENALKSFRVDAEVVGAQVGPAVIMFELTVAQGTRMNRVTALSQEIAATLRARSVRIIAPIPGKATIGIEVPNKSRRTVRMSELVSQEAYDTKRYALPMFIGVDAEGKPIVEDLARMPHLLIAGTTGSGKSVCINTIVASLLLTRSPHDVRLILVDPKMVELQMFANVPHLELPVVTDMQQATAVLQWAVEKMESRYELFKDAGVKNIKGYNGLGEDKLRERLGDNFNEDRTPRHVPYIVLIIDEMADLMMQSKKEAEGGITRLAQKSRAVGIHVIVATQRPSTDVITGVIKGNLPTRIAFQVASKIDSRVILDTSGAEKLLGQGDMLYSAPQSSGVQRVQGALVEDSELQAIVDFVTNESVQTFNQELVQVATGSALPGTMSQGGDKVDPLFNEAVSVVLKSKRGSASLLQRAMQIGYTRASRLIDQMTDAGILGEHRGSKSREIFMTLEDWEENLENIAGGEN